MEDGRETDCPPAAEDAAEQEARHAEEGSILASGPGSGNRAGAFAFLALLVIIAAFLYYHFLGGDAGGVTARIDTALVHHAELGISAMEQDNRLAVVPSWPLELYDILRRDIAVFAALAAAAAYLWSVAARARARRDVFVMHERLKGEIDSLRRRVEQLPPSGDRPSDASAPDAKG